MTKTGAAPGALSQGATGRDDSTRGSKTDCVSAIGFIDVHSSYIRTLPTWAVVLLDHSLLLPGFGRGRGLSIIHIPVIVGYCKRRCLWWEMRLMWRETRQRLLAADCSSCLQWWAVLPLFLRKRSSSSLTTCVSPLAAGCLDTRRGRGRGRAGCAIR